MRDGWLNRDGANYAVVHCTGYIKNWPPQGIQLDRSQEDEMHAASSCCLVAIGRLQVSSSSHWSPSGQFLTPHWLSLGRLPCRHWSPLGQFLTPLVVSWSYCSPPAASSPLVALGLSATPYVACSYCCVVAFISKSPLGSCCIMFGFR